MAGLWLRDWHRMVALAPMSSTARWGCCITARVSHAASCVQHRPAHASASLGSGAISFFTAASLHCDEPTTLFHEVSPARDGLLHALPSLYYVRPTRGGAFALCVRRDPPHGRITPGSCGWKSRTECSGPLARRRPAADPLSGTRS